MLDAKFLSFPAVDLTSTKIFICRACNKQATAYGMQRMKNRLRLDTLLIGVFTALVASFCAGFFLGKAADDVEHLETAEAIESPEASNLISHYAEKIRKAALGVLDAELNQPEGYPFPNHFTAEDLESLMAIEALNLTNILISSPRNAYQLRHFASEFRKPGVNSEVCLDLGYGLCGNHAAVFMDLLKALGIENRTIQFYFIVDGFRYSHIAVEALIRGQWRFLDPHYGRVWVRTDSDELDLATYEGMKSIPSRYKQLSIQTSLWNMVLKNHVEKDHFTLSSDLITIKSSSGVINISNDYVGNGVVSLKHLPSYVGDNTNDSLPGLAYDLDLGEGTHQVNFDTRGVGGCDENSLFCVADQCKPIESDNLSFQIQTKSRVEVKSAKPICYAVLNDITFETIK